jgi:hypothetical protein
VYSVVPSPPGQREKKAMADLEYEVSLGGPTKLEATSCETGNKEKFLLKQSCRSLELDPGGHKKIENSEQLQKCIQKPQRENGGERLGRQREGYQPTAGPHPEPDTSRETLHGSLDVNIQEQEQGGLMCCTVLLSVTVVSL